MLLRQRQTHQQLTATLLCQRQCQTHRQLLSVLLCQRQTHQHLVSVLRLQRQCQTHLVSVLRLQRQCLPRQLRPPRQNFRKLVPPLSMLKCLQATVRKSYDGASQRC